MNSFLYSGTENEKKALKDICEKWLKDSFWPFKEFELSLKIPGTFLHYLEVGGIWQGMSIGRVSGDVAELYFLFIDPQLRGRRLAENLLIDFEAYAVGTLGAESLMLEVKPSNGPAVRLYERVGFEKIAHRKRYYKDGEDAWIYQKLLMTSQTRG